MRLQYGLSALLALSLLAGCASREADMKATGGKPMTGAELLQRNSKEVKIAWNTPQGYAGVDTYRPDGTASVDYGKGTDTGVWRVVDDTLCTTWKTLRNGAEKCFVVYKVGDGKYKSFNSDGSLASDSHEI